MSADPVTAADLDEGRSARCWCCGTVDVQERVVHLGDHPEVHLCLQCAHFVHQRAWQLEDVGKHGPAVVARHQLRNLRAQVMRRGWHQNEVVGGTLRWAGRYLP